MSALQQQQVEPRMRKMLLISPEFLAKLRGHGDHSKQARKEAVKALNAKLPSDQQWYNFRKHLDKYLNLTQKERESFKIPILEQPKRPLRRKKATPLIKKQFVLSLHNLKGSAKFLDVSEDHCLLLQVERSSRSRKQKKNVLSKVQDSQL